MPDDPTRYESTVTRIGNRPGSRWAATWIGVAMLVVTVGLAGALLAPPTTAPARAEVATTAEPSVSAATLPPLIIESTDFHANGGAAYYGIGGKLLRALGPTPTPSGSPTP